MGNVLGRRGGKQVLIESRLRIFLVTVEAPRNGGRGEGERTAEYIYTQQSAIFLRTEPGSAVTRMTDEELMKLLPACS